MKMKLLLVACIALWNLALASDPEDPICFEPSQPFPVPFSMINQKVELSDGGVYALKGWVRIEKSGLAQFEVSSVDQPWLTNATYLLTGATWDWSHYLGNKINLLARASMHATIARGTRLQVRIELEALSLPVLE